MRMMAFQGRGPPTEWLITLRAKRAQCLEVCRKLQDVTKSYHRKKSGHNYVIYINNMKCGALYAVNRLLELQGSIK